MTDFRSSALGVRATDGLTRRAFKADSQFAANATGAEIKSWLGDRLAHEMAPANAIGVAPSILRPHRLVVSARKAVNDLKAQLEESRLRSLAPKPKHGVWVMPRLSMGPHWSTYVEKGYLELPENILPLRVSLQTVDRALTLWDALLKACTARKIAVAVTSRRLVLTINSGSVGLRMSERIARRTGLGAQTAANSQNVPTGELRIFVGEKKFSDGQHATLNVQLNAVLCEVFKAIARTRVQASARALHTAEADLEARTWQIEQSNREELARRAEVEKQLQQSLVLEAKTWHDAEVIRSYIERVARRAPSPMPSDLATWITWALSVADNIDPAAARARGALHSPECDPIDKAP